MNTQLNMNQFAQDAVAKYGSAKVVGEHLQAYIGGDKGRQALVQTIMETDPSSLLKILPDVESSKGFSPTGGTAATTAPTTYTGMTWTEALQVRKENPGLFKSPAYTRKIMQARADARKVGVDFDKT